MSTGATIRESEAGVLVVGGELPLSRISGRTYAKNLGAGTSSATQYKH